VIIDRVQRNTPATLQVSFYVDEALTDPDGNAATFTAVKADGTTHTATTAATRQSQGKYSFNLPSQSALQNLTCTWAGTFSGAAVSIVTFVEIVGSFLFSVAEMRAYDAVLTDTSKYPYDTIISKRMQVEQEFESICKRAFVTRFDRETFEGDGSTVLWVSNPDVTNVTKLTIDGVDYMSYVTAGSLRVDRYNSKLLYWTDRSGLFFIEGAPIVIEYEYGMKPTPWDISEKAKKRARGFLTSKNTRIDERATVINADFGRINLATPGMDMGFGRYVRSGLGVWHTGVPDIDVVLERHRFKDGEGAV